MCRMELYDYDYNCDYTTRLYTTKTMTTTATTATTTTSTIATTDSHGIPVCYAAMAPKHGTTTTPHKPLLEIRSDFENFNVDESTLFFWVTTGVRLSWRFPASRNFRPRSIITSGPAVPARWAPWTALTRGSSLMRSQGFWTCEVLKVQSSFNCESICVRDVASIFKTMSKPSLRTHDSASRNGRWNDMFRPEGIYERSKIRCTVHERFIGLHLFFTSALHVVVHQRSCLWCHSHFPKP